MGESRIKSWGWVSFAVALTVAATVTRASAGVTEDIFTADELSSLKGSALIVDSGISDLIVEVSKPAEELEKSRDKICFQLGTTIQMLHRISDIASGKWAIAFASRLEEATAFEKDPTLSGINEISNRAITLSSFCGAIRVQTLYTQPIERGDVHGLREQLLSLKRSLNHVTRSLSAAVLVKSR